MSVPRSILNYESKFIKQFNVPSEPRLFCLVYNSAIVEYNESEDDTFNEKPSTVFKEIHSFN
jgi:hypothetical protein